MAYPRRKDIIHALMTIGVGALLYAASAALVNNTSDIRIWVPIVLSTDMMLWILYAIAMLALLACEARLRKSNAPRSERTQLADAADSGLQMRIFILFFAYMVITRAGVIHEAGSQWSMTGRWHVSYVDEITIRNVTKLRLCRNLVGIIYSARIISIALPKLIASPRDGASE